MNVLAFSGSLRRGSFNRRLLGAATDLAINELSIDIFDGLKDVPLFNEDMEDDSGGDEAVVALRNRIAKADGILIATPEYNQSLPGGLKNALDWLSRTDVLADKPAAILGATTGRWGTRYAQKELRHVLGSALGCRVMAAPALYIADVDGIVNKDGQITDDRTAESIEAFLRAFARWI